MYVGIAKNKIKYINPLDTIHFRPSGIGRNYVIVDVCTQITIHLVVGAANLTFTTVMEIDLFLQSKTILTV